MIALVDGDPIVYRAGFAAETREYQTEDGKWHPNKTAALEWCKSEDAGDPDAIVERVTPEPVANALYNVKSMLRTTREDLLPEEVILYLSGPENFRVGLATIKPYKGNRDPTHKPVHGPAIREYMMERYGAVVSDGCEADDLLSIKQTELLELGIDSCICTIDKDLDMVPGFHYNYVSRERYYVDEVDSQVYFWRQMLTGDTVDNIPGVKGIGKKGAEKLIEWGMTPEEMYAVVHPLYVQCYGEEFADAALLENGRLLWMQTYEGEMWTPPS
jgi:5'-3' exonuclease